MMKHPSPHELESIDISDIPAYIHLGEKGLSIQTFFETIKLLGFDCLYRTMMMILHGYFHLVIVYQWYKKNY